MWKLLFVGCFFTIYAAPLSNQNGQTFTRVFSQTKDGNSLYRFGFETSNGIKRNEVGYLEEDGTSEKSLEVSGSYSFQSPDGQTFKVTYTSGKDGYVPVIQVGTPVTAHAPESPQVSGIDSKLLCSLCGK